MFSFLKKLWLAIREYWYRGRLDFTYVPDHVCLKILRHLKFKERVRLARVSRRFREMSDMALSQTKFLDLADPMFRKTKPELMLRLIPMCAGSLERVMYGLRRYEIIYKAPFPDDRLALLSKFRCRHLVYLDLGGARIDNGVLRDLLVKCPNLREFGCDTPINTVFPASCRKMEKVHVRSCKVGFLLSLTYQCPNLTSLDYVAANRKVESPSEQLLDEILANVPDLKTLTLKMKCRSSPPYQCANMSNFLKLRALSALDLQCRGVTDQSLRMISKSFGQLERLRVVDRTPNNASLTSQGVGALSSLENLREFSFMRERWHGRPRINDGLQRLASCGRLQRVYLDGEFVSVRTTVSFVQRCQALSLLRVKTIKPLGAGLINILWTEDVLEMLEALQDFQQQNLAICMVGYWWYDIDPQVKEALDLINIAANGRTLKLYESRDVTVESASESYSESEDNGVGGEESGDDDSVTAVEAEEE